MILKCPSCETRYALDPTKLGPGGRRVKCARCGHVWRQEPPDDAALAEMAEPSAAPVADRAAAAEDKVAERAARLRAEPSAATARANLPAKPKPRRRRARALGVLAALLILAALAGLVVGRDQVAAAWPPAEGVYEALGLEVARLDGRAAGEPLGAGLALVDVAPEIADSPEGQRLVVRGAIANPTDTPRAVPAFRVFMLDADQQPLESWRFVPEAERLEPGEAVSFETSRADPHPDTRQIEVLVDPETE